MEALSDILRSELSRRFPFERGGKQFIGYAAALEHIEESTHVKLSKPTLANAVKGVWRPSDPILFVLASALDLSPSRLIDSR